ncbi:MAG: anti-sigma F factor antagonist [Bacillota bacterium]
MRIDKQTNGETLIVRLDGELDEHTAQKMREAVQESLGDEITRLVLNLHGVTFIDSSGLGAILGRFREISQRNGRMCLVSVNPQVRHILELAGVLKIMPLYRSETRALEEA